MLVINKPIVPKFNRATRIGKPQIFTPTNPKTSQFSMDYYPNSIWSQGIEMLEKYEYGAAMPLLNSRELMERILIALENREPCSVVSVGATEAFVMAQYTLFNEIDFMNHPEARIANLGIRSGFQHRGVRFPNLQARDAAVDAVRKADIIGYNVIVESARSLTERVFSAYDIRPELVFEANLRRVLMFSQQEKFQEMLRGRRILLISSLAPAAKIALEMEYQDIEIVGTIPIYEYEEIPSVKRQIAQYDFDLCLLAAGVNAVILAAYIAETTGKVAVDIGSGMESIITGKIVTDDWLTYIIGLEHILSM